MKMNAWMKVGAIGFAASLFAAGCVVTSTTDNGDGGSFGGSGGSTGGSGGSTGGTAGAITCNPQDPQNSKCDTCMQTTCCNEWEACQNDATCRTEFGCIKQCVDAQLASDGGTPDVASCAGQCAQGSVIVQQTNDLVACVKNTEAGSSCDFDCFGGG
jgi:hypothetical protein